MSKAKTGGSDAERGGAYRSDGERGGAYILYTSDGEVVLV